MKVSSNGVDLIKSFEGFVGHPYRDAVGQWTIGYGHTGGVGPNTPHITEPQATALLAHDLNHAYAPAVEHQLAAYGTHTFNRNRFDALVSLAYNLGPGILAPVHTIGAALKAHQWKNAANAFLLYDHAGGQVLAGLKRRREAERALFLKPTSVKA